MDTTLMIQGLTSLALGTAASTVPAGGPNEQNDHPHFLGTQLVDPSSSRDGRTMVVSIPISFLMTGWPQASSHARRCGSLGTLPAGGRQQDIDQSPGAGPSVAPACSSPPCLVRSESSPRRRRSTSPYLRRVLKRASPTLTDNYRGHPERPAAQRARAGPAAEIHPSRVDGAAGGVQFICQEAPSVKTLYKMEAVVLLVRPSNVMEFLARQTQPIDNFFIFHPARKVFNRTTAIAKLQLPAENYQILGETLESRIGMALLGPIFMRRIRFWPINIPPGAGHNIWTRLKQFHRLCTPLASPTTKSTNLRARRAEKEKGRLKNCEFVISQH